MIKQLLNEWFFHNPMQIEISRFRRRYFSFSTGNSNNSVVLTLILLGYAGLVLIVEQNRSALHPISVVIFETVLLTVFAPMMLYGSIAGERERRSWDLLLAAPITKSQIVFGKFMGAMVALAIAVLLFQLPILISAIGYRGTDWMKLALATLTSYSFVLVVCALTIFFSARVKRGLMALGAVLGILASLLIVFRSFVSIGGPDRSTLEITLFFDPFTVLSHLMVPKEEYMREINPPLIPEWSWGLPQIFVYLGLTLTMLAWASNTLVFAENEVKFIPRGDKNA